MTTLTMHLCAAILLVALATGYANAQSIEYDITNCSAYYNSNTSNIHHVPDNNDCRYFYNCDNNNGGKRTACPAGTTYDQSTATCTTTAPCRQWDAVCGSSTMDMLFPALCCRDYFVYNCGTKTKGYFSCPPNQQFNPNTRVCDSSFNTNCSLCGQAPQNDSESCVATHQVYVDDCHYMPANSSQVMSCAEGTYMSREQCRCIQATNLNSCSQRNVGPCNSSTERYLNNQAGRFMVDGIPTWITNTNNAVFTNNECQFNDASYIAMDQTKGNSFSKEYTIRLRVTYGSLSGARPIFSVGDPSDPNCNSGSRISMTLSSGRIDVNFADGGRTNTIGVGYSSGNTVTLRVTTATDAQGTVSSVARLSNSNGQAVGPTSVPTLGKMNDNCGFQLGRFQGAEQEFAFSKCATA